MPHAVRLFLSNSEAPVKRVLTPLAMAAIVLLVPGSAGAQNPCGYFNGPCEVDGHDFVLSPENSCNAHTDCGWCLQGACHPVCGNCPGSEDATDVILKLSLTALQEAASAGDLDEVLRLARGLRSYVAFNVARQSVQIRSCSADGIMANLPVRNEGQRLLAMRMPTPGQMLATARALRTVRQVNHGFSLMSHSTAPKP